MKREFQLSIRNKRVSCSYTNGIKLLNKTTVDSRYLDLGYLEQPFISKRKSVPRLNLTSGNKILWIRGEIAPQEQFLPFPTIFFYIYF